MAPPRVLFDLEAALRGAYVADAGEIMERFFRERPINALSVTAADFRTSLDSALVAANARNADIGIVGNQGCRVPGIHELGVFRKWHGIVDVEFIPVHAPAQHLRQGAHFLESVHALLPSPYSSPSSP